MFTQHAGCNGAAAELTRRAELVGRLVIKLVEFVIKYPLLLSYFVFLKVVN